MACVFLCGRNGSAVIFCTSRTRLSTKVCIFFFKLKKKANWLSSSFHLKLQEPPLFQCIPTGTYCPVCPAPPALIENDPLTAPQRRSAQLISPFPPAQKEPLCSAVTVRGDGSCAAKTALLTPGAVSQGPAWLPDIAYQQPLPYILIKAAWPRGPRRGAQVLPGPSACSDQYGIAGRVLMRNLLAKAMFREWQAQYPPRSSRGIQPLAFRWAICISDMGKRMRCVCTNISIGFFLFLARSLK